MSSKKKGDLLESIVSQLCSGIKDAKVTNDAKIKGQRSNIERQIDVLIEGKVGAINIKIVVEAKNYDRPVGIEKVEALKTKLDDVIANMGVIVCPSGYTQGAKNLAQSNGIKLFEVFDPELGNSNLFIPLRYISPEVRKYQFSIRHRSNVSFSMNEDLSTNRFHLDNEIFTPRELVYYAWNKKLIPHSEGMHIANFNAIAISDVNRTNEIQYCELEIKIDVKNNVFLKFIPASFLKDIENNQEHHNIKVDTYEKEEDMVKNGWEKFESLEEANKAADIENQPDSVRDFLIKVDYVYIGDKKEPSLIL
ncbi:MAG: hypothetical protein A3B68_03215 [Candidatus Melainabacteria bacterium RIFCSPHIGHO2_02_FULL_34_12]|nr:MAG: hypothetical protein A3B68_03215 [Candidatus Melainabacteria bacterium RIFCSPHIGHO2_02_FULL_34_12]